MDVKSDLQNAVDRQLEEDVLKLLQSGINLKENDFGTDLLLRAVNKLECDRIIDYLLQYGAQANYRVLISAIQLYDETIIEKLLKHGASAKESGDLNSNALHNASSYNHKSKVCEVLIKYGAEVNQMSNCRITPLFIAIDNRKNDIIEVLLQYGAQPLKEFDGPRGKGCPLQYIFDLSAPVIENIVKYATLQVNSADDKCIPEFLAHFKGDKSKSQKSKLYFQFASKCLAEVEVLKQHWIKDHKSTLFDFVVAQKDILNSFLGKAEVVNQVFTLLFSELFPIYSDVILKKFERITLINKFLQLKWSANYQCKEVCLDTYSIEYICKFLSHKDLRNLFLAFASSK